MRKFSLSPPIQRPGHEGEATAADGEGQRGHVEYPAGPPAGDDGAGAAQVAGRLPPPPPPPPDPVATVPGLSADPPRRVRLRPRVWRWIAWGSTGLTAFFAVMAGVSALIPGPADDGGVPDDPVVRHGTLQVQAGRVTDTRSRGGGTRGGRRRYFVHYLYGPHGLLLREGREEVPRRVYLHLRWNTPVRVKVWRLGDQRVARLDRDDPVVAAAWAAPEDSGMGWLGGLLGYGLSLLVAAAVFVPLLAEKRRLVRHGVATVGWVTATKGRPRGTRSVHYEFADKYGRRHDGVLDTGSSTAAGRRYHVGATVAVLYDPNYPASHVLYAESWFEPAPQTPARRVVR